MTRDRWLLVLSAALSCSALLGMASLDGRLPGVPRHGDAVLAGSSTLDPHCLGLHRFAILAGVAGFTLAFSVAVAGMRRHAAARREIRAREDLLAVVSHDMRNPLGAVALNADLIVRLAGAGIAGEGVCGKARLIRRSAQHMEVLIRDLLDAAAIEAGRFPIVRARHQSGRSSKRHSS